MQLAIDSLSWIFLISGSLFCILGGVGMNRLPDFYSRMHGAGMTDSLGAGLILLGLSLQSGVSLVTVKLITIWVFLYLTSPASTHALARAAYAAGLDIDADDGRDEAEDGADPKPIRPAGAKRALSD